MAQNVTAQQQATPPANGMAKLADQLIERLGVADALRVCRENSWHGVLNVIQGRCNNGTTV